MCLPLPQSPIQTSPTPWRVLFFKGLLGLGLTVTLSTPLAAQTVNPSNLGKGDWIFQMPQTETRLGVSTTQAVINYEVSMGMKWITVKCGDGTNIDNQFTATLVNQAHAANLKIFGFAYAYGYNSNQVTGEIAVATNALSLGADGFIIDAEIEYETNKNNNALATQYCQGIRAAYPNTFLAHAPVPYISDHAAFPYIVFGTYCDAVMPQCYWIEFQITPASMVSALDNQWSAWQKGLTGTNRNAIKPIIPMAQSYSDGTDASQTDTGALLAAFVNALKADANPATAGGYKGVGFWNCQERNADMDSGVSAATIGTNSPAITSPPQFQAISRLRNGGMQILFKGQAGSAYAIDASSNFVDWQQLLAFTNTTGSYQFTNTSSTNIGRGYYRARLLTN